MMNFLPIKEKIQSKPPPQAPILPDELISKILLLLSLKTIVQLKCVSKSWNTLISDPIFIQMHLKISSQNPHLILTPILKYPAKYPLSGVKSFPVSRLLENPSINVSGDNFHSSIHSCQIIGSCHGLLCLLFHSRYRTLNDEYRKYWFCLWNPATREISKKSGTFEDSNTQPNIYKFTLGCDISTGTYKVVTLRKVLEQRGDENKVDWKGQVRVFTFGDNCWRKVQSCPMIPVILMNIHINRINNGVHSSGTVNWLALPNYIQPAYEYGWKSIANAQQFVIVSLDLSTETYTQILLPRCFDEVPCFQPTLHVLMNCLCFSHDFKRTEFVIWKMKDFGIQESWTQLFRIEYLKIYHDFNLYKGSEFGTPLLPLHLSRNGDTLILANCEDDRAIIYNRRDKGVERIRISNKLCWFSTMDYVESLVSTHYRSATSTPSTSSMRGSTIGKSVQFQTDKEDELRDIDSDDEGELSDSDSEDDG
ncbi:F-box/kelch-repeat protein At3g23880-like [Vicia villosa]|uniref:F-box/kelch-repeat protein At3g23880-like n=1 Tax=Vicia villosa TaxID=3911 RepID=UPI00273C0362|nr:F-box/kelch-repeat protein At3g23880-like [Vicia villosa]